MHVRLCLCPPRVVCQFPLLVWQSYDQISLPFKVRWPGNSKSLCQNRRLGCLMWGAELSQWWENFFGIFVLQLRTQWVMGFEFIVIVPLLLCCCDFHFFFERGVSFSVCSSVLLLIVVQQLVAVMVQEETNRHPPTPPSWNRSLWNTVWSNERTGELEDTRSASGWEEWNSVASI